MALNQEDGGRRQFIQVQLPEPTDESSDAYKAGYKTISAISRDRLKKAGIQIQQAGVSLFSTSDNEADYGYRAYKLSESGLSNWRVQSDIAQNELEQHLLDLRDSANDTAVPIDLLIELLLKQGYSLSEDFEPVTISGLDLLQVANGLIYAYLDQRHKPELGALREVLAKKPARFIILEDSFQGDDELKTNLLQECKSQNVELWTA
jgi:adenine-specific DNA-methyltransferase